MYLSPAQSKRFYGLFNGFTTYVNKKYKINDKLFDKRGHRINEELQKVTSYIWEHREIIDEFVSENPLNFTRQELETIYSWRYAINGRFLLMEHTSRHSAFFVNDMIFQVIGISQDIAEVVPRVPSFVETTLLPFENAIIYSISIISYAIEYGANILEIFEEDYERTKKKFAYVSNPSGFIRASKEYYESEHSKMLDRKIDEYEHEQRKLKGELPAGMHQGVLAGKTDEDRQGAIFADLDENCRDFFAGMIQKELRASAWRRKPRTDLKGTLECMPRENLENLLILRGNSIADLRKKDDLVSLLMSMPEDFDEVFRSLLDICSPAQFEMIRLLMSENGILWIPEDEASIYHMECAPLSPYLNLYYNQHRFAYVLPKEFLEVASAIDMDEIAGRREDLQTIHDYAAIAADLYGIISVDDFFSVYAENYPDPFDDESIFDILKFWSFTSAEGWELWENDEDFEDDAIYIINAVLLDNDQEDEDNEDEEGEDEEGDGSQSDGSQSDSLRSESLFNYRQYLLARHQQIPLKPYDIEEICQGELFDYVTSVPEVRALRDYLDAHVPDDQDDLYFADNIIEALYSIVDWVLEPNDIIDALSDYGLVLYGDDIAETNDMLRALNTATNAMPRWSNNGWTPNELVASKSKSKPKPKGELISIKTAQKIGRNDPCPCGSGKKYKKCHGRLDDDAVSPDTEFPDMPF
ncbi:MAG: SEC-C domain-containing protein [Coriobacteriales bacterium]|jgi:hypothetical protein|nr:SEC-C domain-containing protein [Coriobacteriales bacterium]